MEGQISPQESINHREDTGQTSDLLKKFRMDQKNNTMPKEREDTDRSQSKEHNTNTLLLRGDNDSIPTTARAAYEARHIGKGMLKLLQKLLAEDPAKRLTAKDLLRQQLQGNFTVKASHGQDSFKKVMKVEDSESPIMPKVNEE